VLWVLWALVNLVVLDPSSCFFKDFATVDPLGRPLPPPDIELMSLWGENMKMKIYKIVIRVFLDCRSEVWIAEAKTKLFFWLIYNI
jgi:hypothetical protein